MSLRSKVLNTLGPSSLQPVMRKTGVDPMGPDSTSDIFVLGPVHFVTPLSATVSGTYQSNYGYLSFDGNVNSYWSMGGYPPGNIYYDFGTAQAWRQIKVLHNINNDGRPGAFNVEGSNDASTWTVLNSYGSKPPNQTWVTLNITDSTPYRYVRLNATASGSEWWAVNETEFWAVGAPSYTAPTDPYGIAVASDGPFGFWRLDETSGLIAADTMGSINGIITDGTVVLGETGALDKSFRFTNISGYVRIGTPGILHNASPLAFSAECWFKVGTVSGGGSQNTYGLFSTNSQVDSFSNNAWDIAISRRGADSTLGTSGPGQLFASVASGGNRIFAGWPVNVDNNQWHHAVMTYDGRVRLYVDGVFRSATNSALGNVNTGNNPAAIGLDYAFGGSYPAEFFPGNIDEAAFYRRTLTDAQVKSHYYAGIGSSAPAPAAWLMEDSLATTSNLTFAGGGTWDTASGWLNMASPPNDTTVRAKHSYQISTAFDRHILQCEVRIPTNFGNGTESHLEMGFSSGANGDLFLSTRWHNSVGYKALSWLKILVSWTNGPSYSFVDGQWYTLRLVWDVPSGSFTSYLDGKSMASFQATQSEANMYPYFALYKYSSTSSNFAYRNLKYWGGSLTDPTP